MAAGRVQLASLSILDHAVRRRLSVLCMLLLLLLLRQAETVA
jgi:hypothetical protein